MDIKNSVSQGFILGQEEVGKLKEDVLAFILTNIAVLEKMSIKELKKLLLYVANEHGQQQEITVIIKNFIKHKKGISNA